MKSPKRVLDSEEGESERQHVVHLTTVHHPQDPRISHKQLPTLQEAGFEVTLIATGRPADRSSGLETILLPPAETRLERLRRQASAYREARSLDADVYQVHDPELLPLLFWLRRSTGAATVYDMHEDYRSKGPVLGRVLRALERWAFRWLDHVLLAEESYRSILEEELVSSTQVLNYFKPVVQAEGTDGGANVQGPSRLVYTGTVSRERGLTTMLGVGAEAQRQSWNGEVRIVGRCHRPSQWKTAQQRQQDEAPETIALIGGDTYVPKSKMATHHRWADVGLALFLPHSNYQKSMPTKFYEYLYYGLPIICSDFPLWRDFVEMHECGVVVPPDDPEAVLDVLSRWQAEPGRYRSYVENARAAASQYRWAQIKEPLLSVYRELCPEHEESGSGCTTESP